MKKITIALSVLVVSTILLFSFSNQPASSIKGTVTPGDKATKAWALSFDDTIVVDVQNGNFEMKDVPPGEYAIVIEAEQPFANVRVRDVVVGYSGVTNVGPIELQLKSSR
jgi:hypothetical protein